MSRLGADEQGAVAIEFALWSLGFFLALLAAFDFGSFYLQRSTTGEAVSAAAVQSFVTRDDVNFTALPAYVRTSAEIPSLDVELACNGVAGSCTNLSRRCACLNKDGGYTQANCGTICPVGRASTGSTAGYYLSIRASAPFSPMLLPDGVLKDSVVQQHGTVRLQ
ncbi:TadE/TadG family type IV pilus assembly protein [Croceicoccus sp. F390]|uniref:TadE/TadG family type IV pilus assembly protein n=1 Tax=Croceicoccus esteveae TaxID=3075597 RepID=A0ABU2ZMN2_9SPHN|nr:TadE/TadG family type IV pilus assembly protein [Croceicoccus sp. F390]MDT0576839.1 TadE/TadG family type IV pilus assembly protein [Croceicoccus sp. F390]